MTKISFVMQNNYNQIFYNLKIKYTLIKVVISLKMFKMAMHQIKNVDFFQ